MGWKYSAEIAHSKRELVGLSLFEKFELLGEAPGDRPGTIVMYFGAGGSFSDLAGSLKDSVLNFYAVHRRPASTSMDTHYVRMGDDSMSVSVVGEDMGMTGTCVLVGWTCDEGVDPEHLSHVEKFGKLARDFFAWCAQGACAQRVP
jgi:hypothetical protein